METEEGSGNIGVVHELVAFKQPLEHVSVWFVGRTYATLLLETIILSISLVGEEIVISSNFVFLSSAQHTVLLATFGIISSYCEVFFASLIISFVDKLGIAYAVAFGERDHPKCKKIFTQGFLFACAVFIFAISPLAIYSKDILYGLGIAEDHVFAGGRCLKMLLTSIGIRLVKEVLKTFCLSQGIESIFGLSGLPLVIACTALNYYLVVHARYELLGYVISITVYECASFIVALIAMRSAVPGTMGFVSLTTASEGLLIFFWDCVKFMASSYLEFVAYEFVTYMVAQSQDDDIIAGHTATFSISMIVYSFGLAFSNICRTRIIILIGMKESTAAKNFFRIYWTCVLFTGVLTTSACYLAREYIADLYVGTTSIVLRRYFLIFLTIYIIEMPSELTLQTTLLGIRTINKINTQVLMNFVLLCFCHPLICILIYISGLIPYWYFISQAFFIVLLNILSTTICFASSWDKLLTEEEVEPLSPLQLDPRSSNSASLLLLHSSRFR